MLSESGIKVKIQLEDLNQSKRRIRNLKNELEELIELGSIPKKYDCNISHGKGEPLSPQEKYVYKLDELTEKIFNAIDAAIQIEHDFLNSIDGLDTLSQNLLMERYMQGKSLQKIISEFNYSERHIYNLYNKSYEELSKNIKNKVCSKFQ